MGAEFFNYPKLAAGTLISNDENSVGLNLGQRCLTMRNQHGVGITLSVILAQLQSGLTSHLSYYQQYPSVNIDELIGQLDEYGLLVDAGDPKIQGRDGKAVITALEQEHWWRCEQNKPSLLSTILSSGDIDVNLMTGLAFEYYFLTSNAYDAISSVIEKLYGEQKTVMIDFLLGEYRHDKLMIKSLHACAISDEVIAASVPLPYTRAITELLGYWAYCDPFAFMAGLFILEGRNQSSQTYLELLKKCILPEGYLTGIVEHNNANSDEDHGDISRNLFSLIDYISEQEQERISARLRQLHLLVTRRDEEIIKYYCEQGGRCPRIFS
jgi:hypothetical protein